MMLLVIENEMTEPGFLTFLNWVKSSTYPTKEIFPLFPYQMRSLSGLPKKLEMFYVSVSR